MSELKPRINGSMMQHFKGQNVILVGKVEDLNVEQSLVTLQTSDGLMCNVLITNNDRVANVTEFYGTVTPDGKMLREISRADFNDDFDFTTYDQMINLCHHQFRSLFYG
eukprot:GGOE01002244.1.p1 GENE.GGOE01002244.1~~GGOE01002244.1.p1  ORF type:complete len:109 (-),score=18.04 GGOE01002244.1:410-736(-)